MLSRLQVTSPLVALSWSLETRLPTSVRLLPENHLKTACLSRKCDLPHSSHFHRDGSTPNIRLLSAKKKNMCSLSKGSLQTTCPKSCRKTTAFLKSSNAVLHMAGLWDACEKAAWSFCHRDETPGGCLSFPGRRQQTQLLEYRLQVGFGRETSGFKGVRPKCRGK